MHGVCWPGSCCPQPVAAAQHQLAERQPCRVGGVPAVAQTSTDQVWRHAARVLPALWEQQILTSAREGAEGHLGAQEIGRQGLPQPAHQESLQEVDRRLCVSTSAPALPGCAVQAGVWYSTAAGRGQLAVWPSTMTCTGL